MVAALNRLNISQWVVSIVRDDNTISPGQALATSVTFPPLTKNFDSDARAGLPGVVPIPLQFSEQELTISLRGITEDFITELASRYYKLIKVDISGVGCDMTDQSEVAVRVVAEGNLMTSLGLELTAQDSATSEVSIMLNKMHLKIGTTEIIYDPMNYNYSVNGVNQLAAQATLIGITPNTTTDLITGVDNTIVL
ncbi:MAG: hypothetical protein F6K34_01125 [Okeania sp. SIO4D6]|nr:hypothetical protein [Okeania sp. SIO4D6]